MKNNMEENNPQEVPKKQPMSTKMKVLLIVMGVVIVVLGVGLVYEVLEKNKEVMELKKQMSFLESSLDKNNEETVEKTESISEIERKCSAAGIKDYPSETTDIYTILNSDCNTYSVVAIDHSNGREIELKTLGVSDSFVYGKVRPRLNKVNKDIYSVSDFIGDAGFSLNTQSFFAKSDKNIFSLGLDLSVANETLYTTFYGVDGTTSTQKLDLLFDAGVGCEAKESVQSELIGVNVNNIDYRLFQNPHRMKFREVPDTSCYETPFPQLRILGVSDDLTKTMISIIGMDSSNIVFEEKMMVNNLTGEVTQEEPTDLLEIIEE